MNTVGIVSLSILAALFLFALLAGLAALLWQAWSLKAQQAAEATRQASVHAETEKSWASHQAEVKAALESAKGAFTSIRTEVKALLEDHRRAAQAAQDANQKALDATLEAHRKEMQSGIDKINAEALTSVAVRLTQVAIRTEKAIGIFQQLILNAEQSPTPEYAPEAFAPEETRFGAPPSGWGLNQTAELDEQVEQQEQNELFTESPAQV